VNNYVTTGGDAWKHRGIGLVLCGLVFSTALFTTSLDRRLLNVFLWSLIVSGMYAMSAFSFLLASLRL
jgi:hypothetical protein